ncbi:MAG: hypothetical protein ACE5HS_11115 [bacterium]
MSERKRLYLPESLLSEGEFLLSSAGPILSLVEGTPSRRGM